MMRAFVLLCVTLLACGDAGPTGPAEPQNELVFTRANSSTISFGSDVWVWCGAWEQGEVEVPSVHVLAGGQNGWWQVRAVRSDVQVGQPLGFPNTFIWDDPQRADVFIYDPPNELSSQSDDSSGTITFEEIDCGANGTVRFRVDATVGSELGDLPAVRVQGSFAARVTGPPTG